MKLWKLWHHLSNTHGVGDIVHLFVQSGKLKLSINEYSSLGAFFQTSLWAKTSFGTTLLGAFSSLGPQGKFGPKWSKGPKRGVLELTIVFTRNLDLSSEFQTNFSEHIFRQTGFWLPFNYQASTMTKKGKYNWSAFNVFLSAAFSMAAASVNAQEIGDLSGR